MAATPARYDRAVGEPAATVSAPDRRQELAVDGKAAEGRLHGSRYRKRTVWIRPRISRGKSFSLRVRVDCASGHTGVGRDLPSSQKSGATIESPAILQRLPLTRQPNGVTATVRVFRDMGYNIKAIAVQQQAVFFGVEAGMIEGFPFHGAEGFAKGRTTRKQ